MLRTLIMLMLVAALASCSSHPAAPTDAAAKPAAAATNVLAGTPMAVYGHDLNKAKHVQDTVDQQARKQATAIDAETH